MNIITSTEDSNSNSPLQRWATMEFLHTQSPALEYTHIKIYKPNNLVKKPKEHTKIPHKHQKEYASTTNQKTEKTILITNTINIYFV